MFVFLFCIIMWNTCNERDNLLRASLHKPGLICIQVESPHRVLKIYPLHEPGLPICTSIWFTMRLTWVGLSTDENLKIGAIKVAKNLQNPV